MSEREIGVETARKRLGNLVDDAALDGTVTYLTRRGRRYAAITPLDRITQETAMASTNLTDLLAAASTGGATLTNTDGASATLDVHAAARLLATVADDYRHLRLGTSTVPSQMPVVLEGVSEDGDAMIVVGQPFLRYLVDTAPDAEASADGETVLRLCEVQGCPQTSVGTRSNLTRVCEQHLALPVPGALPLAADDRLPGDDAAAESRRIRLDALEAEIAEAETMLARRDRHRLKRMREGVH